MARVLNSYLFPGTSIPSADEPGYHVQTLSPDDHTQDASDTFSRRCVQNIDDGYPVFAAVDLNALYPALAHANHMVIVIGYEKIRIRLRPTTSLIHIRLFRMRYTGG